MANLLTWSVADWCNYKCSYCCEGRFAPKTTQRRYASDETIAEAARFFASLEGAWTVRLAAGEPSTHPGLFEILKAVTSAGHRIDMVTNLSLPLARYERFVAAAGDRLRVLHASLHLEHADVGEFLEKCAALKTMASEASDSSGLVVSCVATHENLPALRPVVDAIKRRGLFFILQRQIETRSNGFVRYTDEESASLSLHFEDSTQRKIESPRGKDCLAGRRWLVLDMDGCLWRCDEDAAIKSNPLGRLGDASFQFEPRGGACPHEVCGCPGGPVTADWPVF